MATKKTTKKASGKKTGGTGAMVLKAPRITEKAARLTEGNAYVFNVTKDATKNEVKKAFIEQYKKEPLKINMLTLRQKKVVVRGKRGMLRGGKKAVVYLSKGETIELA